jgi:putative SOS response-associated peptidase YedK
LQKASAHTAIGSIPWMTISRQPTTAAEPSSSRFSHKLLSLRDFPAECCANYGPTHDGFNPAAIRNTSSPHWRGWLKPENRCLVPFNSFAEYAPEPNPDTKKKDVVWFAINDDRPLTCFGGIWTEFKGDRGTKSKPIPGPHQVYGFLTTSPSAVVIRKPCQSS